MNKDAARKFAAVFTDLLDGVFARRASPSAKEIDFDGLADLLLSVMTLLWLWLLIPGFFRSIGFLICRC